MTETPELSLQIVPAGYPVGGRPTISQICRSLNPHSPDVIGTLYVPAKLICATEPDAGSVLSAAMQEILERLDRIETALATIVEQRTIKEWYSTDEVAAILQKARFTVREWCRLGRIHAEKRACGRGNTQEWIVSHDELSRIRNEGLLPVITKYKHYR